MISSETATLILNKLDGWILKEEEVIVEAGAGTEDGTDPTPPIDPFPDSNKKVSLSEVDDSWRSMKTKATLHIHNNPQILQTGLVNDFWEAVILWTASDLWRKYNHKVESPGEEGITVDNRGKDLYLNGLNILNNLRTSVLQGLS